MGHVVDGGLRFKREVFPAHPQRFGDHATEALADLPHVKAWLDHVRGAVEVVRACHGHCGPFMPIAERFERLAARKAAASA